MLESANAPTRGLGVDASRSLTLSVMLYNLTIQDLHNGVLNWAKRYLPAKTSIDWSLPFFSMVDYFSKILVLVLIYWIGNLIEHNRIRITFRRHIWCDASFTCFKLIPFYCTSTRYSHYIRIILFYSILVLFILSFSLFTNMYSLNNVGPMTEQLFGPGRFLASYLVAGASGNLLSAMNRCVCVCVCIVYALCTHCVRIVYVVCTVRVVTQSYAYIITTHYNIAIFYFPYQYIVIIVWQQPPLTVSQKI